MIDRIEIRPSGQGLFEVTDLVRKIVDRAQPEAGLCTLFVQHTSASLLIQENADPSGPKTTRSIHTPRRDRTTCRPTSARH